MGASIKRFGARMPKIIFVLGGPGAGKGTICEHLNKSYGFHHLSAGELLRQEMRREGSQYGKLIHEINQAGKIVPSHITVGLLENEIKIKHFGSNSLFNRWIPKKSRKF